LLFEIFFAKFPTNFPGIEANFKTGIQKVVQLIQAKKSICFLNLNIKTFQKSGDEKNLKKQNVASRKFAKKNHNKKRKTSLCFFGTC